MIVIGTDTHKQTHTAAAVFAGTGQLAGELTAAAREPGFRQLLAWGRGIAKGSPEWKPYAASNAILPAESGGF